MKIKNVIFENKQYFDTMNKIHTSDKLTVLDAYRINRLVKQIGELNQEYLDLKNTLLQKFGEADEGKGEGAYKIEPDNIKEFSKEMNDLLEIEHDLEIEKLPFPSKIDEGITVADINILDFFFDFGFDEDEKE